MKWCLKLWVPILGLVSFPHSTIAASGDEYWDGFFGIPGVAGSGVNAASHEDGVLFVAGQFTSVGGIRATNIAAWDGTNWAPLGGGVGTGDLEHVRAVTVYNQKAVAAGFFSVADAIPASNIAQWDGANWSGLGSGVNSIVRAMATDGTNLYVAGTFTQAGGLNAANIAKWDGTNWSALGGGIPGQAVDSVAVGGGYVYAGGRFIIGGAIQATNIARWDGTNWWALGKGIRSFTGDGGGSTVVRALLVKGGELYAGGGFRLAGDVIATNIARWNGSNWWPLAEGVDMSGEVHAIAANGKELYIAGFFSSAGSLQAKNIACWDGISWHTLGSGTSAVTGAGSVRALTSNGSELFVGGFFTVAGGKPSNYVALWHIPHALKIERDVDRAVISWAATGSNFILEASAQLPGTNWTEVPQSPVVVHDQLVVTNQLDGASRFYRLRRK